MMGVTVRAFVSDDAADFLQLHRECLDYYRVPKATEGQEQRILSLLLKERHMACHLAHDGDTPVGFATWGLSFPAGPGVSLVMKELFVSESARGKGVGRTLLSALIDVAMEEGCERFDWATDGDNSGAQAFYKAIGAPANAKVSYRIPKEALATFKKQISSP